MLSKTVLVFATTFALATTALAEADANRPRVLYPKRALRDDDNADDINRIDNNEEKRDALSDFFRSVSELFDPSDGTVDGTGSQNPDVLLPTIRASSNTPLQTPLINQGNPNTGILVGPNDIISPTVITPTKGNTVVQEQSSDVFLTKSNNLATEVPKVNDPSIQTRLSDDVQTPSDQIQTKPSQVVGDTSLQTPTKQSQVVGDTSLQTPTKQSQVVGDPSLQTPTKASQVVENPSEQTQTKNSQVDDPNNTITVSSESQILKQTKTSSENELPSVTIEPTRQITVPADFSESIVISNRTSSVNSKTREVVPQSPFPSDINQSTTEMTDITDSLISTVSTELSQKSSNEVIVPITSDINSLVTATGGVPFNQSKTLDPLIEPTQPVSVVPSEGLETPTDPLMKTTSTPTPIISVSVTDGILPILPTDSLHPTEIPSKTKTDGIVDPILTTKTEGIINPTGGVSPNTTTDSSLLPIVPILSTSVSKINPLDPSSVGKPDEDGLTSKQSITQDPITMSTPAPENLLSPGVGKSTISSLTKPGDESITSTKLGDDSTLVGKLPGTGTSITLSSPTPVLIPPKNESTVASSDVKSEIGQIIKTDSTSVNIGSSTVVNPVEPPKTTLTESPKTTLVENPKPILPQESSSPSLTQSSPPQKTESGNTPKLPTDIPLTIAASSNDDKKPPEDMQQIYIGFCKALSYEYVARNQTVFQAIFRNLAIAVANVEKIKPERCDVQTLFALDTGDPPARTVAKLNYPKFISKDDRRDPLVKLKQSLWDRKSDLYESDIPEAREVASCIDPEIIDLYGNSEGTAIKGSSPESPAGDGSIGSSKNQDSQSRLKRTAVAGGTVAAVGLCALYGAAMFIVARRYKRKRQNRRRSSYVSDTGQSGEMQFASNGSPALMGGALIGPNNRGTYGGQSQSSIEGSVRTANISAPLATENSLGWN